MRWWLFVVAAPLLGHDLITTKITWSREISRLMAARCASCHRAGGSAPMAFANYDDVRPWARSIAEEVLERRMPPWNPVKGFGDFAHEAGLSQEEISLLAEWVEGGAPRGEDRYLPTPSPPQPPPKPIAGPRLPLTDQLILPAPLTARGIAVIRMADGAHVTAWAELPDGTTLPLLQIAHFRPQAQSAFAFSQPLPLPPGTRLYVEGAATLALIRATAAPARQSAPSTPHPPVAPAAKPDARPVGGR